MNGLKTEDQWKVATLRGHAESVLRTVADIQKSHRYPYAVMLPENLRPADYDGPDATDMGTQFCGLPVVWGDRFAVLVEVGL